jgi:hypothetical protein
MEWPGASNEYSVELYQRDLYVSATVRSPRSNQRVVDILNADEANIELIDATVQMRGGPTLHFDALRIMKQALLMAIPVETPEQVRQMLLQRTLLGRAARQSVAVSLLLPQLFLEGRAHFAAGAGSITMEALERFFPVTDVHVVLNGEAPFVAPIVLVSRAMVLGFTFRKT